VRRTVEARARMWRSATMAFAPLLNWLLQWTREMRKAKGGVRDVITHTAHIHGRGLRPPSQLAPAVVSGR